MTTPNYGDLTRCPACDDDLGIPPSTEPDGRPRRPSLRLELCGEQRGAMDWRLSLWDGSRSWKASPRFHPARVRLVYRVCGDGHVFLANVVTGGTNQLSSWRPEGFDVIAAVGGGAAGKSYLMLRALSQHLTVSGLTYVDTPVRPARVDVYNADWLEAAPLELLKREYHDTEVKGLPMSPTSYRYMLPFEFLTDQVSPGLVQQILEIHEELLETENVDKLSWGQRIRQPIVRRYHIGGRRMLAAVADLPGDMFTPDSVQFHHHRHLLRNYGTLAWVVDSVICDQFVRFLPPEVAATSVAASMRPDARIIAKTDEFRHDRNHIQHSLADTLTELGGLSEDIGPVQYLLVCVTKADLIRLALHERSLRDLGDRNEVVTGVAAYLVEIARRAGGSYPSIAVDEGVRRSITGWINRFEHEPMLVRKAAAQLADRIVDYYSAPSAFWELVHCGGGADIDVPEREPTQILHSVQIRVPSLDEHVAYSLVPGEGGILRARDVIMSALGCGIAYGLGFGQSIDALLQQRWRELRFYVCSPLVEVPVTVESTDDELIAPRERQASFPVVNARSAALTQLLLSMLRRLRP